MKITIIGASSDIAKALSFKLSDDGHELSGWSRGVALPERQWDLILMTVGRVAPIGWWHQQSPYNWDKNIEANLSGPVRWLRALWKYRNPGASICFFAGSNPNKIMAGYNAYNASKMALLKVVEQLDYETPDVKFFALGPGYVDTKIHKPTLEANWPNERIAKGNPTPIEKIYDCLKWCISQPKEVVGGRNICVSDPYGAELAERLKANPNLFKLRRIE